ncbi:hypothetical protein ATEIFO6365_0007058600 [Aspergillus terreus]|uniref:Uncharacterized protein n=1 Tax=Aspergillus terreus TaxID=33178 RepID=A0A5M3Z5A8_ASPTE|nr:hypothetical protein ATETN484_0009058600 [Aspergillus terreus]GFF18037.1 hypothetical protein ATEIFO6365_0007058600 [Aspergillus terreus]
MADSTPARMPRAPKLRASCDECGAAKLKCDRGHPSCGRCISLGLKCVYGVSRKAGKPRRDAQSATHPPRTPGDSGPPLDYNSFGPTSPPSSVGDGATLASGLLPSAADLSPLDWGPGSSSSYRAVVDLCSRYAKEPMRLDDTAMSSVWDGVLEPSLFAAYSSPVQGTTIPPSYISDTIDPVGAVGLPADSRGSHDCFREGIDILDSLSLQTTSFSHAMPPPTPSSSSTPGSTSQMPLDRVLSLSREASRRLSPLLSCSCARSPHLALLYASIISRILIWYHQAVNNIRSTPSGIATSTGAESQKAPMSGYVSTANTVVGASEDRVSPPVAKSTTLSVAPLEMAVGSFNVDDLRVQAAVQVQLLSGEIRRVGDLIDQFTTRSAGGPYDIGEDIIGGAGSLFQSLDSWLTGKHASLVNLTRSKLRELDY